MHGFASGKEIYLFFSRYDIYGIFGILISNAITSFIIYKTIRIINYFDVNSYNDLIYVITDKKNNIFTEYFSIIINIFLYISFIIMISGFGAFFKETYNFSNFYSILIIAIICFFLFNNSIDYIVKINNLLTPFLIIIILTFSFKQINITYSLNSFDTISINWLFSSILYSSYNSILLIPVIISLKKIIKLFNINNCKCISFCIFIILSALSIAIINLLAGIDNNTINFFNIPVLASLKNIGDFYYFIYGLIIIIAIFTSAISSGYSFINIFRKNKLFNYISFLICFSSLIFSNINFSTLVSSLYPIFGLLGIIQILYLLLKKIPKTDIN